MSAKAYFLEDRVKGIGHYLTKFSVMSVGRNPKCNISTLNPKTLDSAYGNDKKHAAGHVSGIHFHISYDSDGYVYVWDNGSTNGLYIQSGEDEPILRVHKKTRIFPGTSIFASIEYEFFLREEKIDLHAQKKAEERAGTDTTQILKQDKIV